MTVFNPIDTDKMQENFIDVELSHVDLSDSVWNIF